MILTLIHSALGLASEAGEIMEAIDKYLSGEALDFDNLKEEMGDAHWYLALGINALPTATPTSILAANIAKLRARYPDKFTVEDAMNRDLDGEMEAAKDAIGNDKYCDDEIKKVEGVIKEAEGSLGLAKDRLQQLKAQKTGN